MIDFKEYQEKARSTAVYPEMGNNLYYPSLGLAGEAGEVCEKVKKIMRDDNGEVTSIKKAAIAKELGDVLWYVSNVASELNLDLESIAYANIQKLFDRMDRGVIKGSGDDR
jgi:NTP pyrophosphatase (non-canonical NTP hydrolase)